MRKSIKNFITILILFLGIFSLSTKSFAKENIPSATSDFYVNDFANVFSDDEKTRLIDNAITLSDKYNGIQVVITTVESLNGNTIENYALEMYNLYEIGKDDMGLLVLLSTGDRQIRIEVGKAMESYINDSKAGRFIDKYAIPYLKENKFNEGLITLQEALINQIITEVENENTETIKTPNSTSGSTFFNVLIIFFGIIIVVLGITCILKIISKLISENEENEQTIETLKKQLEDNKKSTSMIITSSTKEFNTLQSEFNALTSNYQNLQYKYKTLEDRYNRIQLLYPTADKDVTNMIENEILQKDIALAKEADAIIQKVITLPASKDIVSELCNAKSYYLKLNQRQKSYVTSDIKKLNLLYDESICLKQEYDKKMEIEKKKKLASIAVASVAGIISCIHIGSANNLKQLKKAKSIYDNLDSESRLYFDKSILDKLDKLYKEAKKDKKKKEEEEEKAKKEHKKYVQSSSNHSSFNQSTHHSGFGGRSGGGGATRGF